MERWRRPSPTHTAGHSHVGAFNAVLLQEAHDHVPHISDQFNTYSDEGGLAILLNKDTFLPDAIKNPITEESTSRTVGSYSFGRLRSPTQTTGWCSQNGHVLLSPPTQHGRQETTPPLRSFSDYANMKLFDVDFVGGDFNMAVKGPAADVFSDAEFMAPGSSLLWEAGGRERDNVDCAGFLCMPRRPFHWVINKHGVHTFANEQLGLTERETKAHTTQSSCISGQPTSRVAPARSYEATQHNRGGFLKATAKNERKRQRRRYQATTHEADQTASTASAGKLPTASPTHPVYPYDVFQ